MSKELEYLTSLSCDFVFQNEELVIHHKKCPVFNMFLGTIIYLQDFKDGCLSVYGVQDIASVGVWNDLIDDFSYSITRVSYKKYTIECCEEYISGLQKGTICHVLEEFISMDTMQSLANQLKYAILQLINNDKTSRDIIDYLNAHKSWTLETPSSANELRKWQNMHQWYYR